MGSEQEAQELWEKIHKLSDEKLRRIYASKIVLRVGDEETRLAKEELEYRYLEKTLKMTKNLVFATWALAAATLFLVVVTFLRK